MELVKSKNNTKEISKELMQSVVITSAGKAEVQQVALPQPKEGEVRIKLEGSGVCASNIPVWEGREWFEYPAEPGAPGHEGWGVVDAIGDNVSDLQIGDRVACLSYHAYSQFDIAKADEVVKLPEFLNKRPFPGEALGCAVNIFNRSDIKKEHTVAIVGAGFLGLLLIQLVKSVGAKVIAVSKRDFSLQSALKEGADHLISMDDHHRIIEKVKALTEGNFCERVIEVTGKEWPLNLSIELTSEKGKLIVAGFHQDGMRNLNVQLLNWRGIDMISAHERDPQQYVKGMHDAITAIETEQMDPFPLFTHSFLLENADEAFKYLTERPDGFIKALIINK